MHDREEEVAGWERFLPVAVVIIVAGWSLLALSWPLSGDVGVFSWIADTVHRGGVPYRDAWDTKGPAAWLPSWLVQAAFGRTSWGIRVFDIAMLVAALVALRSCAKSLRLPGGGRVATALYALWYSCLDYWQSAQPDGWVAAWLIVACSLVLRGGVPASLAAGALVGLSTMSKPFYIGYLVVLLMLIMNATERSRGARVTQSVVVMVGTVLTIAGVLLLVRQWGGWDAYVEAQRWTRDVYAGLDGPWSTRIPAGFMFLLRMPAGIILPLALFGALHPPLASRRVAWPFAVGLAGALAGVVLQGRFWQYHGLPLLPFLALLADFGLGGLRQQVAGVHAARFRAIALVCAVLTAMLAPLQQFYRFARSRRSAEAVATYEQREFRYYGRHPGSAHAIIDSLASSASSPPHVMVWGMQLGPQFLFGLAPTTRFGVIRPLFDGPGTKYRADFRAEFEASQYSKPARYWLVPTARLLEQELELRERDLRSYPALDAFLRTNYRVAAASDEWQVLEYSGPSAAVVR